jgi:hypothetical protein
MRMIETALVLHLDGDQVRELGLDNALKVGDECKVTGVAKVTKTKRPGVGGYGPGTLELTLNKISVDAAEPEQQEPMKDYAKRRNAELRER